VHGEEVVAKDVSGYYVANEIKRVHDQGQRALL
jgi:hypothetical protein